MREAAERVAGHPLNHCLIQLYRSSADYISEHADKTLDQVHGTHVVNVSFGASREMVLRSSSLSSCDPGDILQTIGALKKERVRVIPAQQNTFPLGGAQH